MRALVSKVCQLVAVEDSFAPTISFGGSDGKIDKVRTGMQKMLDGLYNQKDDVLGELHERSVQTVCDIVLQ